MALSVLAILIMIASLGVAWGAAALALHQSQQLTVEQADGVAGEPIAEAGSEPGWAIPPATCGCGDRTTSIRFPRHHHPEQQFLDLGLAAGMGRESQCAAC
jgi:hypothetical protein